MLKIGILGAGSAATAHAHGVTRSGLGQIVKVYAPGDGAAIAPRFGARPAHSADEIFGDPAIDAVIIASPTDTHLDYLRAAQAAGKHVLCEVPLVRTAQEADDVEQLLGQFGGRVAAAALVARFDAPITHLRGAVASGELGTIGMVRLGRLSAFRSGAEEWYGDFARSGGVVLDALPHLLDAVEFCFGEIERLHALRSPASGDLRRDYALLAARLKSGAIAHLEVSWAEAEGAVQYYYEIAGSQGLLDFDTRTEPKLTVQAKTGTPVLSATSGEAVNPSNPAPATTHELLAVDFLGAIRENRRPAAPLADGLRATRLALSALKAAETAPAAG